MDRLYVIVNASFSAANRRRVCYQNQDMKFWSYVKFWMLKTACSHLQAFQLQFKCSFLSQAKTFCKDLHYLTSTFRLLREKYKRYVPSLGKTCLDAMTDTWSYHHGISLSMINMAVRWPHQMAYHTENNFVTQMIGFLTHTKINRPTVGHSIIAAANFCPLLE